MHELISVRPRSGNASICGPDDLSSSEACSVYQRLFHPRRACYSDVCALEFDVGAYRVVCLLSTIVVVYSCFFFYRNYIILTNTHDSLPQYTVSYIHTTSDHI